MHAIYYVVAIWQLLRCAIQSVYWQCAAVHLVVLPFCRFAWHATSICFGVWHNSLFNFGRHSNRALTFATRSDRNFHSGAGSCINIAHNFCNLYQVIWRFIGSALLFFAGTVYTANGNISHLPTIVGIMQINVEISRLLAFNWQKFSKLLKNLIAAWAILLTWRTNEVD